MQRGVYERLAEPARLGCAAANRTLGRIALRKATTDPKPKIRRNEGVRAARRVEKQARIDEFRGENESRPTRSKTRQRGFDPCLFQDDPDTPKPQ